MARSADDQNSAEHTPVADSEKVSCHRFGKYKAPRNWPFKVRCGLKNTPKAFANSSPGLERSDNPGIANKTRKNPERVRQLPNPFRVESLF
jgi:hypothetical protein